MGIERILTRGLGGSCCGDREDLVVGIERILKWG